MEFRLEFGLSHGRSRRRVHREEADDELRPRGRDPLQWRLARGRREGPRPFDLPRGRCRRDRARPFHSRCLRARCANRDGETDRGGRPPDEREQHRDRIVEVRSGRGRHLSPRCLAPRMSPVEVLLLLALAAFFAGLGGSYLGIGGGVFLVPFMTLVLAVDIKRAIATSLIGVIATSSGAASVYVRDHLTNLRLAMFLEVATTIGAITGALLALLVPAGFFYVAFGAGVLYAAPALVRVRETAEEPSYRGGAGAAPVKRLNLSSVYFDQEDQAVYRYRVDRPGAGFGVSAAAGLFSGLLGGGGGFIKVPPMNILMRVPMKAAGATSNFMIGVTAAASAVIYYSQGLVDPSLAAMGIIRVFTRADLGTRLLVRAKAANVRFVFAIFLAVLGIAMAVRALGFSGVV